MNFKPPRGLGVNDGRKERKGFIDFTEINLLSIIRLLEY